MSKKSLADPDHSATKPLVQRLAEAQKRYASTSCARAICSSSSATVASGQLARRRYPASRSALSELCMDSCTAARASLPPQRQRWQKRDSVRPLDLAAWLPEGWRIGPPGLRSADNIATPLDRRLPARSPGAAWISSEMSASSSAGVAMISKASNATRRVSALDAFAATQQRGSEDRRASGQRQSHEDRR